MKKLIILILLFTSVKVFAQNSVESGSVLQTSHQIYLKNASDTVNRRLYILYPNGTADREVRWPELRRSINSLQSYIDSLNNALYNNYLHLSPPNQSVIQTPFLTNGVVSGHQSDFYMSGSDQYALSSFNPITHVFNPVVFGLINMQNGYQMYGGYADYRIGSYQLFESAYTAGNNISIVIGDELSFSNPPFLTINAGSGSLRFYPSTGNIIRTVDGAKTIFNNGNSSNVILGDGTYAPYTPSTDTSTILSNVVHKALNETITGTKTFTATNTNFVNQTIAGYSNYAYLSSQPTIPSSGADIWFNSSHNFNVLQANGRNRQYKNTYPDNDTIQYSYRPHTITADSIAQANTGSAFDYWIQGSKFYQFRYNYGVNSSAANNIGGTNVPTFIINFGDSRMNISTGLLRDAYGQYSTINGLGFCEFYFNKYPGDLTMTLTGTYTTTRDDNTSSSNMGINGSRWDASTGATATFTPSSKFKFDACRIWYNTTSGGGTFTYAFDGGTPVSVNTASSASDSLAYVQINTGLSGNTTHTLVITATSNNVRAYGPEFYNKAQSGIVMEAINSGGISAAMWDGNSNYLKKFISIIKPSLFTFFLGRNDAIALETPSTYISHVSNIFSNISLPVNCPSVLITEMPQGLSPTGPLDTADYSLIKKFRYKLMNFAPTIGASVFDLQTFVGPYAYLESQGYYADAVHWTNSAAFVAWSALVRCEMATIQQDYLLGYDSYKNANILMNNDGTYGIQAATIGSTGIRSASGTGIFFPSTSSMKYSLSGVEQLQFSTNPGGTSILTAFPTSTTSNVFSAYRQGSSSNLAFNLSVTSTSQTQLTTNNGAVLLNGTGVVIGAASSINSNSALDLSDITTKGILLPQLSTTTIAALTSPTVSLLTWNTTTASFQYRISTGSGQFVNILSDFHPAFQANTTNTGFFNSPTGVTESSPVSGDWSRPSASVINFYDGTSLQQIAWISSLAAYQPVGNYITGLTGDVIATGPRNVTSTLATVNSNVGTFGATAGTSSQFTVNAKGLITAAQSNSIQIAESQVTNLTTDLALKAPLASPALTGVPTAPTASPGTNTTQLATTAFSTTALTTFQNSFSNGFTVFGNSISAATGATNAYLFGYAYLVGKSIGGPFLTYANSGDQVADLVYRFIFPDSNPQGGGTDPVTSVEIGTNDVTTYNTNTNQQTIFKRLILSAFSWPSIPQSSKTFGQAFSLTGFTNSDLIQKGLGITSVTNGNTASGTITTNASSNIYVYYLIKDGNTGTFTIKIDGTLQTDTYTASTTINAFGDGSATIATANGTTSGIACLRFPVASSGSHTVLITNTGTTGQTVTIYAIATNPTTSMSNPFTFVVSPNHQNNANDALSGTYAAFESAIQTTLSGDGLNITYVDTRTALGTNYPTYYSDALHTNNAGHALMASTYVASVTGVAPSLLKGNVIPSVNQNQSVIYPYTYLNPTQFQTPNGARGVSATTWNAGTNYAPANGNPAYINWQSSTGITVGGANNGSPPIFSIVAYNSPSGIAPSTVPTTANALMTFQGNMQINAFPNSSDVSSTLTMQNNLALFGPFTSAERGNALSTFFANNYVQASSLATTTVNVNSPNWFWTTGIYNGSAITVDDIGFQSRASAGGANPNIALTAVHANGGTGKWGLDFSLATNTNLLGKASGTLLPSTIIQSNSGSTADSIAFISSQHIVEKALITGSGISLTQTANTFTIAGNPAGLIIGTPTITAGAGAGTSPTVIVTSNGRSLQVTVTTGTLPTGTNAIIATVTLANALSYTPYPVFSSPPGASTLLSAASMIGMSSTGPANVTITSGTTALTASTTYIWNISL